MKLGNIFSVIVQHIVIYILLNPKKHVASYIFETLQKVADKL